MVSLVFVQCLHGLLTGINSAVPGNYAGAIGAEFLKAFKGYIENPTSMLLWRDGWPNTFLVKLLNNQASQSGVSKPIAQSRLLCFDIASVK